VHAQPGDDNINIAPRLGAISDKTTNVTIYGWSPDMERPVKATVCLVDGMVCG
jgi:hypothetical protein